MPRFGPISRRDLVICLRNLGLDGPSPGGNHEYMEGRGRRVRIPNPHRGDVSVDLLARILRQANVSREEWEEL